MDQAWTIVGFSLSRHHQYNSLPLYLLPTHYHYQIFLLIFPRYDIKTKVRYKNKGRFDTDAKALFNSMLHSVTSSSLTSSTFTMDWLQPGGGRSRKRYRIAKNTGNTGESRQVHINFPLYSTF